MRPRCGRDAAGMRPGCGRDVSPLKVTFCGAVLSVTAFLAAFALPGLLAKKGARRVEQQLLAAQQLRGALSFRRRGAPLVAERERSGNCRGNCCSASSLPREEALQLVVRKPGFTV